MLIGIVSDTHGRVQAMREAMEKLKAAGAEYFIHAGDVGSTDVLDEMAGVPGVFVFGNTDYDRHELESYAEKIGVRCGGAWVELELDGKKIAVIHGDDVQRKRLLIARGEFAYLIQGHTHVRHDEGVDKTRIINPGALHRATKKTCALLDTATDKLRFIEVEG